METKKQIDISFSDNFFTEIDHKLIYDYCINAPYLYGESDNKGDEYNTPPTGMTHNVPETSLIYKIISKTLYDRVEFIRDMKLQRMYINCFAPKENGYFHQDGDGYTFLYYPNLEEYHIDEGGETKFLVGDDIHGILPIPNRMAIFYGNIPHSATGFRNFHRFTVAIKYFPK